jgi:tight adherence protein C
MNADLLTDPSVRLAALAVFGVGLFGTSFLLASIPSAPMPLLGPRGLARARAVARGGVLAVLDPVVRRIAGWIARIPSRGWREAIDRELLRSGYWMGATADEVVALSALYSIALAIVGTGLVISKGYSPVIAVVLAAIGATHPFSQLRDATKVRLREVDRRLPDAVDLLSLCMGAGLDFPAALRRVLADALPMKTPMHDELARVSDELDLGKTRVAVLLGLAERAPSRAVSDFVGAVVQAEQKGTPLREILNVQARVLRMRRSVLAEEAAARAALQLMIPLVMIFFAIMLLILGPVVMTLVEL